jgi:mitogen-activated protein kinase kinase kinase 7
MTARLGTSLWMCPEVFSTSTYSVLADVYSYAIVLWEIWTRREPYDDQPATVDIPYEVCHNDLRPPISPGCPRSWTQLMQSCWHKDPACRPTFKSIVAYLLKYEAAMSDASESSQASSSSSSKRKSHRKRTSN